MQIKLNGEPRQFDELVSTVEHLLIALNLPSKMKIVELNGTLFKEKDFPSVSVNDGDIVEIVQFMGGGL
jgi:sulfur carrier protein